MNKSDSPSPRLLIILLFLTLLLSSCEQLGYLVYPIIPSTNLFIPPAPYDEVVGDCALVGKSEEIETWLTELEGIAESCRANLEPNWEATLAARAFLDSKVGNLKKVYDIPPSEFWNAILIAPTAGDSCGSYNSEVEDIAFNTDTPLPTHYYTSWLKKISQDVIKYCTMVDEIVKPLWRACDEINFYQDCQAPDPEQYHSIIEMGMTKAQINFATTEVFYENTLLVPSWDNFRLEFDDSSLDCVPDQQALGPTFILSNNAFCRLGPSVKYEKVATFLKQQSVQIDGRNQNNPRWWWVLIPVSGNHCWVSDSTGSVVGLVDNLEIIAAPLLVINPENDNPENVQPEANTCSKDLGARACTAAGGTWTQSSAGPYYCDCK